MKRSSAAGRKAARSQQVSAANTAERRLPDPCDRRNKWQKGKLGSKLNILYSQIAVLGARKKSQKSYPR